MGVLIFCPQAKAVIQIGGVSCETFDTSVTIDGVPFTSTAIGNCWASEPPTQPVEVIGPKGGGGVHTSASTQAAANSNSNKNPCADSLSDPVLVSTGTKVEAVTEFQLPGEMGLSFKRYYTSHAYGNILNGAWRANIDYNLIGTRCFGNGQACSPVKLAMPDGSLLSFSEQSPQASTPTAVNIHGPFLPAGTATLTYDSTSNTYTVRGEDSNVYLFDYWGTLTKITNPNGISWTLTRPDANTVMVTHTSGQSYKISTTLNTTNLTAVVVVTDPAGSTYTYNSTITANSVTGSTLYEINSESYPGNPATTVQYKYQVIGTALEGVLTETDYNGVAHDVTQYDSSGRVTLAGMADGTETTKFSYGSNSTGAVATVTNPLGLVTTFQYNSSGLLVNMSGSATASCPATTSSVNYDSNGNMSASRDNAGNLTTYTYAPNGQLTGETEASGTSVARTTTNTWDTTAGTNRLLSSQISGYNKTAYSYDDHGHLASVTVTNLAGIGVPSQALTTTYVRTYYSNGMTNTLTITPPGGQEKQVFTYDAMGRGTQVQDAMGHISSFSNFTALGSPQTVTSQNGDVTSFLYDARGRIQSIKHTYNATNTATYTYASNGLVSDYVKFDGERIHYDYDSAFRVSARTWYGPSGAVTIHRYAYDANGDIISDAIYQNGATYAQRSVYFDYDELGRRIKIRENGGQWQSTTYDLNGNPKSISTYDGTFTKNYDPLNRVSSVVDGRGGTATYKLDAGDHITQVTDPRGLVTTYDVDGLGIMRASHSPDTGTTNYLFDSNGSLSSMTRNDGSLISVSHDALGRTTQVIADGITRSYIYDSCTNGLGHLCNYTDGTTSASYAYDKVGNVSQRTTSNFQGTSTDTFLYNGDSRLNYFLHGNYGVLYTWTDGNVSSIDVAFGGQTYHVVSGVMYDGSGLPSSLTYGNGLVRAWGRDTDGRVKTITTDISGGANLQYLALGWDYSNRLTIINDYHVSSQNQQYTYDANNQVTQITGLAPMALQYDANGNRIQQNTVISESAVVDPSSNHMLSRGAHSYTYDAVGNRATHSFGGSTDTYTYDSLGHMTGASRSAAVSYCEGNGTCPTYPAGQSNYYYDAIGLRTRKITPIETTYYGYLLDGSVLDETSTANGYNFYIYLSGQLVGLVHAAPGSSAATLYYAHSDHLGRPQVITDATAQPVWTADNMPFDRAITLGSLPGVEVGLPGQIYDAENGTWFNRARDYDPSEGKYLQPDPLGLTDGSNPYQYVHGNPLSNVDPMGLCTCTGAARVRRGNPKLVGKGGAFNGTPSNIAKYGVTSDSTAVIPSQWGMTKDQLRPVLDQVSGTLSDGTTFNGIRDIMDDSKTRQAHHWSIAQFQSTLMSQAADQNDGVTPLMLEIPGIPSDLGVIGVTVDMPDGSACPQGTH
nr:RHS repeat-associated core domain-containing protein [Pinirhizobacter soli]